MSQSTEEMEPVIPVEQDLVPFEQMTLLGVRLPDNRVAALFSLLCEILHLDSSSQARRIRADPAIADCLIPARIQTPGGPQVLNVLIAGAIPIWLSGIRLGKVAPELRSLLLALKREAADVLYRHFFKIDAGQSAPPPPERPKAPRAGSSAQMLRHASQALHTTAHILDEGAEALEQEQEAVMEQATTLQARQAVLEATQAALGERQTAFAERQAIVEEVQEALGEHVVETQERVRRLERGAAGQWQTTTSYPAPAGPLLTKDHLYQLYALARDERQRSGTAINDLLRELAEALGVADLSDLPDAAWQQARAWFWQCGQPR